MEIKCKECGKEFTDEPNDYPGKVYEHHGEALCEDCLIGMGVLPDHERSEHTRLLTETAWFYRM
jgi:hypothetical protein